MFFKKLFGRTSPQDQVTETLGSVAGVLLKQLDEGRTSGTVVEAAVPLYNNLILGTVGVFTGILTTQPFTDQLAKARIGDGKAILAAYLQLMSQRVWDLHLAFDSDPAITEHIGKDFLSFMEEFVGFTGIGGEFFASTFESAGRIFQDLGNGFDFRPVHDMQTFDFLQTLTEGRYTKDYWRTAPVDLLTVGCAEVGFIRLNPIRTAKDQMGLPAPVIGMSRDS